MNIEQLPDCVLQLIAAHLPTVSQQFMAIAMTAPSSSWIKSNQNGQLKFSNAGKVLLSETSTVDVIDFREEYSLHRKLTDDDLGALLVAIDAKNNLKKLFLNMRDQYGGGGADSRGCKAVVGHGLECLRNTNVLVQIDVSIPNIKEEIVIPILDSIMASEGTSLKHIQIPQSWRGNYSFLQRWDQYLYKTKARCDDCGGRCGKGKHGMGRSPLIGDGLQVKTCYGCLTNSCCHSNSGMWCWNMPEHCSKCDRYYCRNCASVKQCGGCSTSFCNICEGEDVMECSGEDCEEAFDGGATFCFECEWENIYKCTCCNSVYCDKCSKRTECGEDNCETVTCDECAHDYESRDLVPHECRRCKEAYCNKHLWESYQHEKNQNSCYMRDCSGCQSLLFPLLEEQNDKLSKEVDELKSKLASM